VKQYDILVVGAGFAGAIVAERLATQGHKVHVIDKRPHIAGNAYDCLDDHGVLIHQYGPHIFHANAQRIVDYLSNFTAWRSYEHEVLASVDGKLVPIPINRNTLNALYDLELKTDEEAAAYLEQVREPVESIKTSEDVVINAVGRDLYEKFFKHYTRKQWGLDPSQLNSSVTARIPTRTNTDNRYFTDTFQVMPRDGYTVMFENILNHPNITVELGVDFMAMRENCSYKHLVYTGPIDQFYDYRFGKLPYRSLRFEHEHLAGVEQVQAVGTVNYPNDFDYTRITEFKHLSGQSHTGTSVVREYPQNEGDPYYPVPRPENQSLYQQYSALALTEENVSFVGRLAQYQYYNMDQVVGAALTAAEQLSTKLAVVV
jgi:UDP-galactopyranose mutase